MHPFDQMKRGVGFSPDDEARLRALWPAVQPRLDALTGAFRARILAFPGVAALLRDEADRLDPALAGWIEELVCGPWDLAYVEGRERIGRAHADAGLPSWCVFAAMNVLREGLCAIAREAFSDDGDATCVAIARIADIDLAILTGTWLERRELPTLGDIIVTHLPVAVLLVDAGGRITAATRLFGDAPIVGDAWVDALPAALAEAADLEAQAQRALACDREIVLPRVDVTLDGEDRHFRLAIVPLDHPQARMLVHVEDLSETVRTEARLARAESLAQLGALSAAVAHELRNPLAGISGAIQVIARSLSAEDRRKPIMEKVEQQVRRLDALVTDLLDFARPTTARMGIVAMAEVARAVVEQVQRDHPGVRIRAEGEAEAWADPSLVHQILVHLVLNAAQALDGNGDVLVRVAAGRVLVNDSGPGIPAENVEKIFAPFFTTRTRGMGLGLAIGAKAASAMGGQLRLGSGPLPGAAFVLELGSRPPAAD